VSTVTTPRPTESRSRDLLVDAFSGTPGRMRIFGAIAVIACALFGILAFAIATHFDNELEAEREHAEQLVRVQTIRTSLVKADASATNAFLVAGLEAGDVRTNYEEGIATAAEQIAEAAGADSSDSEALMKVNRTIATYTGMVESARANNRQGFPVGAAYLREASKLIQSEALPALEELVNDETDRIDAASNAGKNAQTQLGVLLLVVLAGLIATQIWLFVKTHRVFNPPLALATVLVLVAGVVGLAAIAWSRGQEKDTRETRYLQTVGLATARINALDAKSNEALVLVARGSGQTYEQRFSEVSRRASEALDAPEIQMDDLQVRNLFDTYLSNHGEVVRLEKAGSYDQAVALATGDGAANSSFAQFEKTSASALAERADQLSDDLSKAQTPLVVMSFVMLAAGLVAALAARRGIAQRLREYR
jgi:hypothetical protein